MDLRQVAHWLMGLTGVSMAELARRSEVHRPNCLAWLAGKERVFSEANQLKVCETLGWRFGRLRRDVVHRWVVGNDLSVCRKVLEGDGRDVVFRIFQTTGASSEGAVAVLGLADDEKPLVILIRRPLGKEMPEAITAKTLGLGFDGSDHRVSGQEWAEWWYQGSPGGSPDDYLGSAGRKMLAEAQRDQLMLHQSQVFADGFDGELAKIMTVSREQEAWLGLLDQAMAAGMGFEEVMRRVGDLLRNRNELNSDSHGT